MPPNFKNYLNNRSYSALIGNGFISFWFVEDHKKPICVGAISFEELLKGNIEIQPQLQS